VVRVAPRPRGAAARVVVVGGGAGGVEVAFCLEARLRRAGAAAEITLLHNHPRVLSRDAHGLARRVEHAAAARGIRIRGEVTVAAAEAGAVVLASGERVGCEALVWVTGAASHSLFLDSGLPLDSHGFLRVRPTLQFPRHD